jgi:hypothetical protein
MPFVGMLDPDLHPQSMTNLSLDPKKSFWIHKTGFNCWR